jgi:hypothetical protein
MRVVFGCPAHFQGYVACVDGDRIVSGMWSLACVYLSPGRGGRSRPELFISDKSQGPRVIKSNEPTCEVTWSGGLHDIRFKTLGNRVEGYFC